MDKCDKRPPHPRGVKVQWNGGACPVPDETRVRYWMRSGDVGERGDAGRLRWKHKGWGGDIVAYEVISEDVEPPTAENPKDAVGSGKVPFSTVPAPVIAEIGLAMLEGARKYRRHNYRVIGVRASVYYDAAQRHLTAWWEGEDIDPDSGLPHIVKALSTLTVLRDAQIMGKQNDDRPPVAPAGWVAELNAKAKAITEKYPNDLEPYTAVNL